MNKFYLLVFLLNYFLMNCTLKPPAITFTQSQTAAEKQMVGEDKELEKDGWLISSIKTSSSGSDEWRKDTLLYEESEFKDKDYYTLLSIIAYLAPEVKFYKSKGLLGEGLNGLLQKPNFNLEDSLKEEFSSPEKRKRLEEVTKLVNDSRVRIYETRILSANMADQAKEDNNAVRIKIIHSNYKNIEPGEYYEASPNKWLKK